MVVKTRALFVKCQHGGQRSPRLARLDTSKSSVDSMQRAKVGLRPFLDAVWGQSFLTEDSPTHSPTGKFYILLEFRVIRLHQELQLLFANNLMSWQR